MKLALAHGAYLDHDPHFLAGDEAAALLARLRDELRWEQREVVLFGRRVLQPRLIAWAGALPYRYSGQTLEPRPATPTAAALMARVSAAAGATFNHLLANRYRDGRDSMGLHADDERELGPVPTVATLSLGATRRFVVKPRRGKAAATQLDLAAGSLLVMNGACQHHYVHGVPRQPSVGDERISLTFRWVATAPGA